MKRSTSVFALGVLALSTAFAAERDETRITQRIEQIKASDTSAWRRIPWTASLGEALRAGASEQRPIFVFTHDGNIETGRC